VGNFSEDLRRFGDIFWILSIFVFFCGFCWGFFIDDKQVFKGVWTAV